MNAAYFSRSWIQHPRDCMKTGTVCRAVRSGAQGGVSLDVISLFGVTLHVFFFGIESFDNRLRTEVKCDTYYSCFIILTYFHKVGYAMFLISVCLCISLY
jgi:hypothetical protein